MATKNSTLLVTTLLTQTRDRTAEDILFQTGRKESGTRPSKSGGDYFLANHGLLNKKFSQSRNPIFGGTAAGSWRRTLNMLKAILQFVTPCHRR